MEQLNFYDMKTKQKFATNNYKIVSKSGRRFAVANHNGTECWRVMGKV